MAKKKQPAAADAFTSFKYGMPIYGLAWPQGEVFYMCGGGGSVSSGIKNRVVCAQRSHGMLTDQVADYDFGKNCPMRLAITPKGRSIVLAMAQGGIQRLDIDVKGSGVKLNPVTGDLADRLAKDKLEVKALAFCPRGDHLVLGGVDGTLRVLRWPTLEERLSLKGDARLADSIRDVSAAPGPRAARCAVVLDNGTAEVWDWDTQQRICQAKLATRGELRTDTIMNMVGPSTTAIQALPSGMNGARFACLRYAPQPAPASPSAASPSASSTAGGGTATASTSSTSSGALLYALMNNRNGCWVVAWEQHAATGMLHMLRHKRAAPDPASCMDVSPCGRLLAVGTSQSVILVLDATTFEVISTRPKAHTVFCTGVVFSPDSQHVLSVSGDASAILTTTQRALRQKSLARKLIVTFIIAVALSMAILLQVIRVLKMQGRPDLVEAILQPLRAVATALQLHRIPLPK